MTERSPDQEPEATTPDAGAPPEPAAQLEAVAVDVGESARQAKAAPVAEEGGHPAPAPANGERREPREGGERPERGRRRFGRRRICTFCVEKTGAIDYKDPGKLRRYLSDRARIEPRRKTGTCAKHQRWLAVALKRARHLALLPYTPEHIRASGTGGGRR